MSDPDARKGTLSVFDQGIVSATNFFTGVIIGRSCTKEEFGLFTLGFSLVYLILGMQHSLISLPYTMLSPRLTERERFLYRGSALIQQIGLSLFFALGLVAASLVFSSSPIVPVLRALSFTIGLILLKECIRQMSFANLDIGVATCLDTGACVLQIGGLLALSLRGMLNPVSACWVCGVSYGVPALVWILLNRHTLAVSPDSLKKDIRRNLDFGKWVLASGILYSAGMDIYPWFLNAFMGAAAAGVWAACLGISSLGNPMYFGIQNYLSPRLAHVYHDKDIFRMKRFVLGASMVFAVCMSLFALFLTVFGGALLEALYGGKYAGNGAVVSLLGFNLVVSSLGFAPSRSLFVLNRADMDLKTNFVVLATLTVLGISLMNTFGLTGAAYGLFLSAILSMALKFGAFSLISRKLAREAAV